MSRNIIFSLVVLFLTITCIATSSNAELPKPRTSRLKLLSNPKSYRIVTGRNVNRAEAVVRQEESYSDSDTEEIEFSGENTLNTRYDPTWKSLDSRPLPQWYDEGKIGIFIHWGVFSVPGFGSEWCWYYLRNKDPAYVNFMAKNYAPDFTYQDFGTQFTAEFFDPYRWAEIFNKSGATHVVLTSKHHEGFTLWPSKYSFGWNAVDIGPHRDLVGELATAIRNNTKIRFGLYHSLLEWFNPLYLADKSNNFTTTNFAESKAMKELYEIVNKYKPDVIWSDGEWEASEVYWKSREFLSWLYNDSPVKDTVVTNDRWGKGTGCKHGGFYSCNDRYNPGVLVPHKWENCFTLDKRSWGYRRNAQISDYLTPEELITTLVETISCGGNILVNVGPTKEGIISPIMEERLTQLGEWLGINGEAVYKSKPWVYQNDTVTPGVWYTKNQDPDDPTVYAMFLNWPSSLKLQLGAVEASSTFKNITLLGSRVGPLRWKSATRGITVTLPSREKTTSRWGWTLAIRLNSFYST